MSKARSRDECFNRRSAIGDMIAGSRAPVVTLAAGMINQNFEMYAGDTLDITVTLTDAEGAPLDLTGLTLWWGMADIVRQVDVGETLTIHLVSADTEALIGAQRHQLRAIDISGRVETLLTGVVRITESVFQPVVVVEPVVRRVA
jgi:hypothetical protein